jgi:hypothetical protein
MKIETNAAGGVDGELSDCRAFDAASWLPFFRLTSLAAADISRDAARSYDHGVKK